MKVVFRLPFQFILDFSLGRWQSALGKTQLVSCLRWQAVDSSIEPKSDCPL